MANPLKIGIVEDETIFAEALQSDLRDSGFIVSHVSSSTSDAIANIAKELPDLLILDVQLLGDDTGVQIAQYVRRNNLNLPLIFLTGNAEAEYYSEIKAVNPSAVLRKPLNTGKIVNCINGIFLGMA
ncbi:MAG: hypothetical protein RL660_347 [Bacteroidota bacterium]|jgi:CheY-like chemotaxis protein